MIKTVRERVIVAPKYIDHFMKEHILSRLKDREHTCTRDGYIQEVMKVEIIASEEISMADGSISFIIDWTATIFKPEKGMLCVATKFLFQLDDRILMDVNGMFNCLIINGRTDGKFYIFDECSCKLDMETLSKPISVQVKLLAVEFKEQKFMTIGEHQHEIIESTSLKK